MAGEMAPGAGGKGGAVLSLTADDLKGIIAEATAAAVRGVLKEINPSSWDELRAQREVERKQEAARLAVKPWDKVVQAGSRAHMESVDVTLRPTLVFWQGTRKITGGPQGTKLSMSYREAYGARGRLNEQEVVEATYRALRERYIAEGRKLHTGERKLDPVPLEFATGEKTEDEKRPFLDAARW